MDIITHRQDGYLAEYLSVSDFSQGIKWALEQDIDPAALRANVIRKYNESVIASKYIDLYNQICKEEE